jgi:hypothetical protein
MRSTISSPARHRVQIALLDHGQYPSSGHYGRAQALPDCCIQRDRDASCPFAVPACLGHCCPVPPRIDPNLLTSRQTLAHLADISVLPTLAWWDRLVEHAVESQADDGPHGVTVCIERLKRRISGVAYPKQFYGWKSIPYQAPGLGGLIQPRVRLMAARLAIARLGREHGQKRQFPRATGPRDARQRRYAYPAWPLGFDESPVPRVRWITINPFRRALLTTPPLDGVANAHPHRAFRHENVQRQPQKLRAPQEHIW